LVVAAVGTVVAALVAMEIDTPAASLAVEAVEDIVDAAASVVAAAVA